MKHSAMKTLFAIGLLSLLLAACGGLGTPAPTVAPTASATDRQVRVFEMLWSSINDKYVYEDFNGVDWAAAGYETRAKIESGLTDEEFSEALREMIGQLPDGMVVWETREERLERQLSNTATYEGIGAFVSVRAEPEPHVVLLAVMEGSPAATAGLAAHDSIYAIDGSAVLAEEGLDVIDRVRGPAGSIVTLTVESPGGERHDVEVERGQLAIAAEVRAGTITQTNVAYFLVPTQAPDGMANTIAGAWQALSESRDLEGAILDLRIARTAGPWPLGELLSLFADGSVGSTYNREGEESLEITGQDLAGTQTLPLVIVVGPDTEGAPEVLAAALQDADRAQVVGLATPGEVEGTTETALPDGSRVFVASSSFITAEGTDVGLEGVTPDVVVEADWDEVSDVFDPVLDEAVRLIQEDEHAQ
jgi:carboxyl-terminal processing protease